MEQQLRSCLLEGETIRWMGRPSPFCLSRLPFRRSFYLTWLAFAGCSAAAALLLFPPLLDGRRSLFSTAVILAAVLAVPALFSLQPFSDKYKLERHTLYAITNLRALTMVDGHVLSLPLRRGVPTSVYLKDGICGTLCIGTEDQPPALYTLTAAVTGISHTSGDSGIDGLLFFHVPDPDELLPYFS